MSSLRRRPSRKRKPFSYLPFLVLIIFGQVLRVSLLVRKRDVASFAAVDPLNAITILLLMAGCVLLLNPKGSSVIRKSLSSALQLFFVYFALCALSALWSGEWAYTLFRTVQLAVNTMLMCWMMSECKTLQSAMLLLIRFTAIWWFFGFAGKIRLAGFGFFVRDNASACVAAIGLIIVLGAWKERIVPLRKLLIPGGMLLAGLVSGLSAAANVSAIFGAALVFSGMRHRGALLSQAAMAVVVIGIGWNVVQSNVINDWLMPGKTQSQITSLHGRTSLWNRYYQGILERPVLGYGFPVGEKKPRTLEDGTEFGTTSAHNSIVGIAINTGIVGLFITLCAAGDMLAKTNRSVMVGRAGGITIVAVMATAFLNSLAYPVIGSHWNWPTTVVQGIAGIAVFHIWVPQKRNRRKLKRRNGRNVPTALMKA